MTMSSSASATAEVRSPAPARSVASGPLGLPGFPGQADGRVGGRGPNPYEGRGLALKHAFDRVIAAVAILLLSPLLLLMAIAVKLSSPGPVLFRQRRVGRDNTYFEILKFRSMCLPGPAEEQFILLTGRAPGGVEGPDRRTGIGRLLRLSSLDELPQLFNVLRGDMSLVGPRPERPEYVELFSGEIPRYAERHLVKPGITGWAQVNGLRGQTSIAERSVLDDYYIRHWSLRFDLRILLGTVLAVLRYRDA
jgi:lipopolysaccharide/colanic/teichoic acid biosynthesis glycosyltransferase